MERVLRSPEGDLDSNQSLPDNRFHSPRCINSGCVGDEGFEPPASEVLARHSTSELIAFVSAFLVESSAKRDSHRDCVCRTKKKNPGVRRGSLQKMKRAPTVTPVMCSHDRLVRTCSEKYDTGPRLARAVSILSLVGTYGSRLKHNRFQVLRQEQRSNK